MDNLILNAQNHPTEQNIEKIMKNTIKQCSVILLVNLIMQIDQDSIFVPQLLQILLIQNQLDYYSQQILQIINKYYIHYPAAMSQLLQYVQKQHIKPQLLKNIGMDNITLQLAIELKYEVFMDQCYKVYSQYIQQPYEITEYESLQINYYKSLVGDQNLIKSFIDTQKLSINLLTTNFTNYSDTKISELIEILVKEPIQDIDAYINFLTFTVKQGFIFEWEFMDLKQFLNLLIQTQRKDKFELMQFYQKYFIQIPHLRQHIKNYNQEITQIAVQDISKFKQVLTDIHFSLNQLIFQCTSNQLLLIKDYIIDNFKDLDDSSIQKLSQYTIFANMVNKYKPIYTDYKILLSSSNLEKYSFNLSYVKNYIEIQFYVEQIAELQFLNINVFSTLLTIDIRFMSKIILDITSPLYKDLSTTISQCLIAINNLNNNQNQNIALIEYLNQQSIQIQKIVIQRYKCQIFDILYYYPFKSTFFIKKEQLYYLLEQQFEMYQLLQFKLEIDQQVIQFFMSILVKNQIIQFRSQEIIYNLNQQVQKQLLKFIICNLTKQLVQSIFISNYFVYLSFYTEIPQLDIILALQAVKIKLDDDLILTHIELNQHYQNQSQFFYLIQIKELTQLLFQTGKMSYKYLIDILQQYCVILSQFKPLTSLRLYQDDFIDRNFLYPCETINKIPSNILGLICQQSLNHEQQFDDIDQQYIFYDLLLQSLDLMIDQTFKQYHFSFNQNTDFDINKYYVTSIQYQSYDQFVKSEKYQEEFNIWTHYTNSDTSLHISHLNSALQEILDFLMQEFMIEKSQMLLKKLNVLYTKLFTEYNYQILLPQINDQYFMKEYYNDDNDIKIIRFQNKLKRIAIQLFKQQNSIDMIWFFINTPYLLNFKTKYNVFNHYIKVANQNYNKIQRMNENFTNFYTYSVQDSQTIILVEVDRQNIQNSLQQMNKFNNSFNIQRPLRVHFKNEKGIDTQGLRQEFFQLIQNHVQSQLLPILIIKSLFELIQFKNEQITPNLLKQILGYKFSYCDYKEIDVFQVYTRFYTNQDDLLDYFMYDFQDIQLQTPMLNVLFNKQFQMIKPQQLNTIKWFTQFELYDMIVGSQELKIKYQFRHPDQDQNKIQTFESNFNQIFDELTKEQKQLLLQFTTACQSIPVSGFQPPFTISRRLQSQNRFPSAATCFNELYLDFYSKKEDMKEQILTAITEAVTFELD